MIYKRPGFEIEAGHGGAIAMMLLPDDVSERIIGWAKANINDSEVYGKEGKGRDGSPHVTLQNGIMCDDADELERLFAELSPMKAMLGPVSVFRNDDKEYDVVHIKVLCDDLHDANAMVSDLLEVNDPHHEYNPHITLAYVKKGAGSRFDGLKDFIGDKMVMDRVVIDGGGIESKVMNLEPSESRAQEDIVPGGMTDAMDEADFDPRSLADGAKHELEHTKNIEIAREIAMDNLAKDKDYYKKIKKVTAKKPKAHPHVCAVHEPSQDGVCRMCGTNYRNEAKRAPLKESTDYGKRSAAYEAEDLESYLLDSRRSIRDIKPREASDIIRLLRHEP